METIGYYCDKCRAKYVRHVCREALPCGHEKTLAIRVYCKAFGRGGENVSLVGADIHVSLYITDNPKPGILYSAQGRMLWGCELQVTDGDGAEASESLTVGEWLHRQDGKVVRAFFDRWESVTSPPLWRTLELIPESNIPALAGRDRPPAETPTVQPEAEPQW
jgi:hypothetical protein